MNSIFININKFKYVYNLCITILSNINISYGTYIRIRNIELLVDMYY